MSRCRLRLLTGLALSSLALSATAQEPLEPQSATPPETIDILIEPQADPVENYEDCEEDQDAATVTGEIIVCRQRSEDENRLYDKEGAERRHAQRTQGPQPVDVAGEGIFRGPPTVSGMCFIPPCPKDPVYMVDFDALPETPAGSDADRIARGLAPRGNQGGTGGPVRIAGDGQQQADAEELGLPPPLEEAGEGEVSPSESASPEEEPSD